MKKQALIVFLCFLSKYRASDKASTCQAVNLGSLQFLLAKKDLDSALSLIP